MFSRGIIGRILLPVAAIGLIVVAAYTVFVIAQESAPDSSNDREVVNYKQKPRTVESSISGIESLSEDTEVSFSTSDLKGVDRVELYIDGVQVAISYKYPFQLQVLVDELSSGVHYVQLKGYAKNGGLLLQSTRTKLTTTNNKLDSNSNTGSDTNNSTPSSTISSPMSGINIAATATKAKKPATQSSLPPKPGENQGGGGGSTGEPQAPLASAPINLVITSSSRPSHTELTWSASPAPASDYAVYRNGSLLSYVSNPEYTDTTTLAGYRYTYRVYARNSSGNLSTSSATSSITFAESTLWSNSITPAAHAQEGTRVELGIRFMPKVDGYITGLRFYKDPSSTEITHEVNLWSASGQLIANSSTYNESESGWQVAYFHEPAAVNGGEMYTASYTTLDGNYVYTPNHFTTQPPSNEYIDTYYEPGEATPSVFAYTNTLTYPSDRFGTSNYWVDALFRPRSTEPTTPATDYSVDTNSDRCPAYPSFPTADCTGVISGTELRECGSHIRLANSTYVNCFFPRGITIHPTATNIKIINSRVLYGIAGENTGEQIMNLTLRDVEIDGLDVSSYGVTGLLGYTCIRCNIHSASVPAQGGQFHIEDSYLHDIYGIGDSHNEAILPFSGINNTLIHNRIESNWSAGTLPGNGGMSAAVALYSHGSFWAGVGNVLIEKNYITTNVAHYCLYGGHSTDTDGIPSNLRVVNNVFGRCSVEGDKEGAVIGWYQGNGNVWANNTWAIDNSLIAEPATHTYDQ